MGQESKAKAARRGASRWAKIRAAIEWAIRPYAGQVLTEALTKLVKARLGIALQGAGVKRAEALREMRDRGFVISKEYGLRDGLDVAREAGE